MGDEENGSDLEIFSIASSALGVTHCFAGSRRSVFVYVCGLVYGVYEDRQLYNDTDTT